jgi:tetratricopeptide (TPR) repeat protein
VNFTNEDYLQKQGGGIKFSLITGLLIIFISLFFVIKRDRQNITTDYKESVVKEISPKQPEQILSYVEESFVTLGTINYNGESIVEKVMGFFLKPGKIVTLNSFFKNADPKSTGIIKGFQYMNEHYRFSKFLNQDILKDLVILSIEEESQGLALKYNKNFMKTGDRVFIVKDYQTFPLKIWAGKVRKVRDFSTFGKIYIVDPYFERWIQGSPVFNTRAEAVGVAHSKIIDGTKVNFIIPIAHILKLDIKKNYVYLQLSDSEYMWYKDFDSDIEKLEFLFSRRKYKNVIELADEIIKAKKDSLSGAYYYKGISLGRLDENEESLRILKDALKQNGDLSAVHLAIGRLFFKQGQNDLARINVIKALDINPQNMAACLTNGEMLVLEKEFRKALPILKRVLKFLPSAKINILIGICYTHLGKRTKAYQAYNKALSMDSKSVQSYLAMGYNYLYIRDWKQGIKYLERGIDLFPENFELRYLRCIFYLGLKDKPLLKYELKNTEKIIRRLPKRKKSSI